MKIIDLLDHLHVPYLAAGHHHTRAGWIQIDCPYCGKDTQKWHMGYPMNGWSTHCWRCGRHSLLDTLMSVTGKSYGEIKKLLDGLEITRTKKEDHQGKLKLPGGLGPLQRTHEKYLRSRGFDPKTIIRFWGIQGIGLHSGLAWRLFIPIRYQGRTVSWTTRACGSVNQRYISAASEDETIPHKTLLYGEEYTRDSIIITEGPLDVWAIGPGAVATCGIGYSRAQLLKMSAYHTRVVCFDNDPAAQRRATELVNDLGVFSGDTYNVSLDAEDAGSASDEEITEIRNLALIGV
jgi:hypothetical protein